MFFCWFYIHFNCFFCIYLFLLFFRSEFIEKEAECSDEEDDSEKGGGSDIGDFINDDPVEEEEIKPNPYLKIIKKTVIKDVPCSLCDKKFKNWREVNDHIFKDHNEENIVGREDSPPPTKSPNEKIVCDFCFGKFGGREELREHILELHAPNQDNFTKCQSCKKYGKLFEVDLNVNPKAMEIHLKDCENKKQEIEDEQREIMDKLKDLDQQKKFNCYICKQEFAGSQIKDHFDECKLKQQNEKAEEKKKAKETMKCDICNLTMHPKGMYRHYRQVHNQTYKFKKDNPKKPGPQKKEKSPKKKKGKQGVATKGNKFLLLFKHATKNYIQKIIRGRVPLRRYRLVHYYQYANLVGTSEYYKKAIQDDYKSIRWNRQEETYERYKTFSIINRKSYMRPDNRSSKKWAALSKKTGGIKAHCSNEPFFQKRPLMYCCFRKRKMNGEYVCSKRDRLVHGQPVTGVTYTAVKWIRETYKKPGLAADKLLGKSYVVGNEKGVLGRFAHTHMAIKIKPCKIPTEDFPLVTLPPPKKKRIKWIELKVPVNKVRKFFLRRDRFLTNCKAIRSLPSATKYCTKEDMKAILKGIDAEWAGPDWIAYQIAMRYPGLDEAMYQVRRWNNQFSLNKFKRIHANYWNKVHIQQSLESSEPFINKPLMKQLSPSAKGLYIWGSPGRGKTTTVLHYTKGNVLRCVKQST